MPHFLVAVQRRATPEGMLLERVIPIVSIQFSHADMLPVWGDPRKVSDWLTPMEFAAGYLEAWEFGNMFLLPTSPFEDTESQNVFLTMIHYIPMEWEKEQLWKGYAALLAAHQSDSLLRLSEAFKMIRKYGKAQLSLFDFSEILTDIVRLQIPPIISYGDSESAHWPEYRSLAART